LPSTNFCKASGFADVKDKRQTKSSAILMVS
jgi:hypothetical protein